MTSEGYIVKSWGTDYPFNGGLFVLRRFDINDDGSAMGFKDMCSLQALGTAGKYNGSYERVAKTINNFVSGPRLMAAREQFFSTLILSVLLRNGDAHLKNFGVVYDDPLSNVDLAPVYDIVTTTAYIRNDVPALTLAGTKKWWPHKFLERFAVVNLSLQKATVLAIFDRMAQAVTETQRLIPTTFQNIRSFVMSVNALWHRGMKGLKG